MLINYLVRRLLFLGVIVWSAATINFYLPRLSGQDPIRARLIKQQARGASVHAGINEMIETYDKKFGLDKPLWQQYLTYLGDLARFDLGQSIAFFPREVKAIIRESLLWTIGLLGVSTLISFAIGSLFGALIAWPKTPRWVRRFSPVILPLSAIPYYLLGLILLFVFAFEFTWFPGRGGYTPGAIPAWTWRFALDVLKHSLLPALSIVLSSMGFWALDMRGMMVTIAGQDYMTMAEAKGLKSRRLFLRYGIRNALLPQVTSLALAMGFVLSGAVLVEVVFNYPGIGLVLFNAIKGVDYPVIQGVVFTIILSLAIATLILDLTLPLLDPRITYGRS